MTEQQVPMLMRISLLLLALQQRQVRPESEINIETPDMQGDMSGRTNYYNEELNSSTKFIAI